MKWEAGLLRPEPSWIREPSIEVIESLARKHLSIRAADRSDVVFYAKGGFNKLFRVSLGGKGSGYIMRVALPVDPHYKTSSKVTTIKYIHSFTKIPIPNIVVNQHGFGAVNLAGPS